MSKLPRKYAKMPSYAVVKADIESGMSFKMMQAKYRVAKSTLRRFLTGNQLSKPNRINYPDDDVIVACLAAGEAISSMADRFGISRDSFRRRVVEHQLRDRLPPEPPEPEPEVRGPKPSPQKVINAYGVSVPSIPTIHGRYEVRT